MFDCWRKCYQKTTASGQDSATKPANNQRQSTLCGSDGKINAFPQKVCLISWLHHHANQFKMRNNNDNNACHEMKFDCQLFTNDARCSTELTFDGVKISVSNGVSDA
jgi:hypothetical protein